MTKRKPWYTLSQRQADAITEYNASIEEGEPFRIKFADVALRLTGLDADMAKELGENGYAIKGGRRSYD